jgi:hypothetical protein
VSRVTAGTGEAPRASGRSQPVLPAAGAVSDMRARTTRFAAEEDVAPGDSLWMTMR